MIYFGYQLSFFGAFAAIVMAILFSVISVKVYLVDETAITTNDWVIAVLIVGWIIPMLLLAFYGWLSKFFGKSILKIFPYNSELIKKIVDSNYHASSMIWYLNIIGYVLIIIVPVVVIGMLIDHFSAN